MSFDSRGRVLLPTWCRSVKIDVGLSFNAKMSFEWLKRQPKDLIVFGFEPVLYNLEQIMNRILLSKDSDFLKQRLILLPLALGVRFEKRAFYVTEDTGQSSLLAPTKAKVSAVEPVQVVTLESFMSLLPYSRIPLVDHLKTDCQGTDVDVLRGAGKSIERFICITAEAETANYKSSKNSLREISGYLETFGFIQKNTRNPVRIYIGNLIKRFDWAHNLFVQIWRVSEKAPVIEELGVSFEVEDPTYLNTRLVLPDREILIFQRG